MPVAWITSTGPVARSTAGWRVRCHASYSATRVSGQAAARVSTGSTVRAAARGAGRRPRRGRPRPGPAGARTASSAVAATPPGTRCQHCSRVTATRSGGAMTGRVSHAEAAGLHRRRRRGRYDPRHAFALVRFPGRASGRPDGSSSPAATGSSAAPWSRRLQAVGAADGAGAHERRPRPARPRRGRRPVRRPRARPGDPPGRPGRRHRRQPGPPGRPLPRQPAHGHLRARRGPTAGTPPRR